MTVREASRASPYREKAMTLRLLASEAQSAEVRLSLLTLADRFEKLAVRVEVWEAMPTAAD